MQTYSKRPHYLCLGRIIMANLCYRRSVYMRRLWGFASLNISTNLISSILLARSRSLLIWTRSSSLSGGIATRKLFFIILTLLCVHSHQSHDATVTGKVAIIKVATSNKSDKGGADHLCWNLRARTASRLKVETFFWTLSLDSFLSFSSLIWCSYAIFQLLHWIFQPFLLECKLSHRYFRCWKI
jgi:hypothetical protein